MSLYQHIPHPRIASRNLEGPTKVNDHRAKGKGAIGRLNARFGLFITVVVGTMWCAYLFTLIALVSLPAALGTGDKIIIVAWIAQTFLQLVLLPIIIVGQNVQAAAADARAEATYKDADAVLHTALAIEEHLQAQDVVLERLIAQTTAALSPSQRSPGGGGS